MDSFDILQIVGEGWFGKILLVEHKATDTEMVLKGKENEGGVSSTTHFPSRLTMMLLTVVEIHCD